MVAPLSFKYRNFWEGIAMNGGEVVVNVMLSRGVETVFFVPGGTNTTIMESLSRNQNKIQAIPTRLESSAAFACDTYSKFKK